ncbi:MAG: hypothetical protein PWP28_251 [Oceanotoga sp.]|uniref:hypothetical protein n=1 Tax=Oceanotoga sp. TaxID=2108366 RepID=UPI002650C616|nr:hypothetical protein [Oceanotoga sp.]MDN5341376.1 hypothetical protein [Oceanotoga sp.]
MLRKFFGNIQIISLLTISILIYINFQVFFISFLPNPFTLTFLIQIFLLVLLTKKPWFLIFFIGLLIPSIEYYIFNLMIVIIGISIFIYPLKKDKNIFFENSIFKLNRSIFPLTVLISYIQWFSSDLWVNLFPIMRFGNLRGAGFQIEPSFMALPLFIYIFLQHGYYINCESYLKKIRIKRETFIFAILIVIATKSISVLVILPYVFLLFSKLDIFNTFIISTSFISGFFVFSDRISKIIDQINSINSLNIVFLINKAFGSWRNIPDFAIILNPISFLFPTNPTNLRDKINMFTSDLGYSWVISTFNYFSAMFSTLGIFLSFSIIIIIGYFFIRRYRSYNQKYSFLVIIYSLFIGFFILPKGAIIFWFILSSGLINVKINERI